MKTFAMACAVACITPRAAAQTCDSMIEWPVREVRWWNDFLSQTEGWELGTAWCDSLFQIQCNAAGQAESLQVRMEAAETRQDAHLTDTLQALRAAQDRLRAERTAQFFRSTPVEWWPALGQVLEPKRPDVLHFGVHDRMKCVVCAPPENQAP